MELMTSPYYEASRMVRTLHCTLCRVEGLMLLLPPVGASVPAPNYQRQTSLWGGHLVLALPGSSYQLNFALMPRRDSLCRPLISLTQPEQG